MSLVGMINVSLHGGLICLCVDFDRKILLIEVEFEFNFFLIEKVTSKDWSGMLVPTSLLF